MRSKLIPALTLALICLTVALILASVNLLTEEKIAQEQYKKEQSALKDIMPAGDNFTSIYVDGIDESITAVYSEDNGGYIFKVSTKGYNSGLVILCGIDAKGNLTGVNSTQTSETPSKENGIGELFNGMNADSQKEIIVSGATKTSKAYSEAVRVSYEAFEKITAKEDK